MTVPPTAESSLTAEIRRLEQSARTALSTARSLVFLSTTAFILSAIALLRTC